ncbi:lysine transporter LysE [Streptomyces sp. NPDC101230]|uniref:lysine transporter LysE n=1 Tax=unclassified Streptomyces TaxID=2593676 RepID=UPI003822C402
MVLTPLACAVLAAPALIARLSWSFDPRLTLARAGLFGLFLAHGAWAVFRHPPKGRRRTAEALAMAGFTLTAATALFLLFYAPGCDCL